MGAVPSKERTESAPPHIDRYELLEKIARGGMGTVYRARDRSTGKICALKYVQVGQRRHDKAVLEGFEREYQILSGLSHPRIIRVFDYGVIERGAYYTMELLEGMDLRRFGKVPWRAMCQYLRDVATCLSLLHARRLLHRDLSPGNVKLTDDGHCKLIDFGALTEFGQTDIVIGTPPFIAPEVLRVGRMDHRVDLYALGALAYYCLTGQHAYKAEKIADLPAAWLQQPAAPSSFAEDVPAGLDELVMSLLRENPLARPASAAEVIARLDAIAGLSSDDDAAESALAQSFLAAPRFVGQKQVLARLNAAILAAGAGAGQALRIEGPAGAGRTRLLEELAIRAQVAGAVVLRADASAQRGRDATVRALDQALHFALPQVQSGGLVDFEQRLVQVSRERTLVVLVDNAEHADDGSIGALIGIARALPHQRIVLVITDRTDSFDAPAFGFGTLRAACDAVKLENLSRADTAELMRSLFGEASRAERLADWMHAQTAGSPLHCLGLLRHLVSQDVIRHERGTWVLPSNRPDTQLSDALEDSLSRRLGSLSAEARELVYCLSLQRLEPTLGLCRALVGEGARGALVLLDELAASDVLHRDQDRYLFSSAALRQAVLKRLGHASRRASHLRLGRALSSMAGAQDLELRVEAGWHLIRGGDELRGADMIAEVTQDSVACNVMVANLFHIGAQAEAALKVYRAARKSRRERMPLLSALAQAGYYEHYRWAEAYGDDALDAVDELSGLRLARRLRPFLGGLLALGIAFAIAAARHYSHSRKVRGGSFIELLVQTCCTVTALSAIAAISLNPDRCDRVAEVLKPASVLPKRIALVGIYRFCRGLQQIAREHQVEAFETFDELAARFAQPGYFLFMPPKAHLVYVTGSHFARGAFAMMRADGSAALKSAAELDKSGLPLYAMIASQLRYLYHLNRGELSLAQVQRERVELHAARVGSAWQVELWEPASLLPFYIASDDVVELSRVAYRLAELAEAVPSMWRYRELALLSADMHKREPDLNERLWAAIGDAEPRSFIGWSTVLAIAALHANQAGRYAAARDLCERALSSMTDGDRDYVLIFLQVDIQAAIADAGLGKTDQALARLHWLLARHGATTHALSLGLIHEARARIAFAAARLDLYGESLREATRWLRPTGTPTLVALCDRLARLGERGGSAPDLTALTANYDTGLGKQIGRAANA